MLINVGKQTINFKIVYYGAAFSGKTTNIRYIAERARVVASDMLMLETRGSRTIYFDMVRLSFGRIGSFATHFNLYTTPGQNVYIAARRLVLHGADAIVFVMDSQQSRLRDNVQAWYSLERQLLEMNIGRTQIPIIIQLNKRDMPYVAPVDQLLASIHSTHLPSMEACADSGVGVFATLEWVISHLVTRTLHSFQMTALPAGAATHPVQFDEAH